MNTDEPFQGGEISVGRSRAWLAVEPAHHGRGVTTEEAPSSAVDDYENRFHAVRSGLAAVSGALHVLLGDECTIESPARDRLESILIAEIARLQRLVAPTGPGAPGDGSLVSGDIDLDEIVNGVVWSRRAAGQEVAWTPTGLRVQGRRDDITEVLHILLVNAWRHGRGAPSRIVVSAEEPVVVVRVSDDGPGVAPELRDAIFERGVRRPGSPGQGLGLAIARDLVEGLGGSLSLSSVDSPGACFRVTLVSAGWSGAA
jgi:signal transduction histidine kinase